MCLEWTVKCQRDSNESGKTWKNSEKHTTENKSQKEEDKEKRVDVWSNNELSDVASTDLMFSIVSSGIGATVCTAGRFLLVAPLTNDDEEEEEEEAESVAPRQQAESWIKKNKKHHCSNTDQARWLGAITALE